MPLTFEANNSIAEARENNLTILYICSMIVLSTQDSNVMVSCIPTVTIYLSKIWYIRLDSIDKNIVYHIHYSFTNLVSAT